jgi:hypothetical protein
MGVYQQWLHYREVDLLLQEELAQLEGELARLQTALQELEPVDCLEQNPIITALAAARIARESAAALAALVELEQSSVETPASPAITNLFGETTSGEQNSADAQTAAISPALRSWGDLPDFYSAPSTSGPGFVSPLFEQQLPPLPHAEIVLLPEDMNAFFDQHSQTDPQLDLPWWLRAVVTDMNGNQVNGPIDPQSIRTNRLVQRWLERWRQSPQTPPDPGEYTP